MKLIITIFLLSCMVVLGQDSISWGFIEAVPDLTTPALTADLSAAEGVNLGELTALVSKIAAQLRQAQAAHEQELRRLGAAKFPQQFGVAGKLEISDGDYSRIHWIPRSPSCRPHRSYQWLSTVDTPAHVEPLVTVGTGTDSLVLVAESLTPWTGSGWVDYSPTYGSTQLHGY